jgi:hypothetical protein
VTMGILLIAAVVYSRHDLSLYMRQIRYGDPSEEVIMFRIERFVSTHGLNTSAVLALREYDASGVYCLFARGELWRALLTDVALIRRTEGDPAASEYVKGILADGYTYYLEYHQLIPNTVLNEANALYNSEFIRELDTSGRWRRSWEAFLAQDRRDDGTVR